ncbi:MAG: lipoate--protein ligase family protein, partial [Candidatus Nanohaloarchaea archaeon]|nr:lipoate--protein ligase family protein [Candidatus Nanohaloarchaea archaeon]
KIESFSLHGDFFIHPAEELESLERAVEGVPVGTDEELMVRKIENSLSEGTELVGFETSDVAELVKEAVEDAG